MKNLKKFIATILSTTLALGCAGSMSTFGTDDEINDSYYLDEFFQPYIVISGQHIDFNTLLNEPVNKKEIMLYWFSDKYPRVSLGDYSDLSIDGDMTSSVNNILTYAFSVISIQLGLNEEETNEVLDAAFGIENGVETKGISIQLLWLILSYESYFLLPYNEVPDWFKSFDPAIRFSKKAFKRWLFKKVKQPEFHCHNCYELIPVE